MPSPTSDTDPRVLIWDGCLNVRDLGGLPTENSGTTRRGVILRADSVRKLTEAGWEALLDYGVSLIVDLRVDSELAEDPPRDVPIDVVHVSLVPEFQAGPWAEIDALADAQPDAANGLRVLYLEMLERFRENFARAVEAVGVAEGTVVVHCAGGKDRTGLIAALILRLAGVSIEDVAADYSLSADNLHAQLTEWVAAAATEAERIRRGRSSQSPAAAMVSVLEDLEGRYGDVEGYLLAAGASAETLQRLRERLVEETS